MSIPAKPAYRPTFASNPAPGDVAAPPGGSQTAGIVKQGVPLKPQKLPYQWFNWLFQGLTNWLGQYLEPLTDFLLSNSPIYVGFEDDGNTGTYNPRVINLTIPNFTNVPSNGMTLIFQVYDDFICGQVSLSINGGTAYPVYVSYGRCPDFSRIVQTTPVMVVFYSSIWLVINGNPDDTRTKFGWEAYCNGQETSKILNGACNLSDQGNVGSVSDGSLGYGVSVNSTGANGDIIYISSPSGKRSHQAYGFLFANSSASIESVIKMPPSPHCWFFGAYLEGEAAPILDAANVHALFPSNEVGEGIWYNPAVSANLQLVKAEGNSALNRILDTGILGSTNLSKFRLTSFDSGIFLYVNDGSFGIKLPGNSTPNQSRKLYLAAKAKSNSVINLECYGIKFFSR